jgi:hypothetical protein
MTTYRTNIWGDTYDVSGDFSQASSPVDGPSGGRQVADFRHSPEAAMREMLEESASSGGDDPEEYADEIAAAVEAMYVLGSPEHAEDDGFCRIGDTDCYVFEKRSTEDSFYEWRIGDTDADAEEVFRRLMDEHGLTAQEAIDAMEEGGPRGDVVVDDVMEEVYWHDKFQAVYRERAEIAVVNISRLRWFDDAAAAAEYCGEIWGEDVVADILASLE